MIERLLVFIFGGPWQLKILCQKTSYPFMKKILIMIYRYYNYKNNSSIAWNSTFLGEPCFPHGWKNIFISGNATIGSNCVIFQQVSIGSNNLPDSNGIGAPQVGSNCYIGAGAKIIGKVTIEDNCRIGANTVVYRNVPENSIVVSNVQRIINSDKPLNNKFYSFRHGKRVYFENGEWFEELAPHILKIFTESRDRKN